MRITSRMMLGASAVAVVWQLGACSPGGLSSLIPEQAIDFDLAGAGLAEFDVQAGVPQQKSGRFTFDTGGFSVASGSIELVPEVITVTPADTSGGKTAVARQNGPTCLDACGAAGVDSAVCADVCGNSVLQVTVWVASAGDSTIVCDPGDHRDTYGPFDVSLNEEHRVTDIDPDLDGFTARTQQWLSPPVGEVSVCVEVISPIDGVILIGSLRFNVRPAL